MYFGIFAQFYSKKMPTTYSHWKVAVNLFSSFLVFLFFCLFLPYFSFFPLLLKSQSLKIAHQLRCAAYILYIYIYMCWRVIFCTTFWPFGKMYHCFSKIAFLQQPQVKWKVRKCTTGELFSGPPQGCISPPPQKSGTISNSLGDRISSFLLAICFPIFETNCAFLAPF